jgi:hypothetical protein
MRARTKGSVRFDPYYKLETWNPRALAWSPVQRRFETETAAVSAAQRGQFRVMIVTESGITAGAKQEKP